jgi:hypothetical protein
MAGAIGRIRVLMLMVQQEQALAHPRIAQAHAAWKPRLRICNHRLDAERF